MAERTKHVVKQERFTYQWYLPSQKSERPPIEVESQNPDGYIDAPAVAEDPVSMEGPEVAFQDTMVEETATTQEATRQIPHRIYSPRRQSSGEKPSLGLMHLGGSMRIRLVAMGGWSAMAGAGAVALLTRAGPFPGTQLEELGAVWAGIAAFLWIAVAKLSE